MKQKRVILLEAVSTGIQAGEDKNSIPDQDQRLHELVRRNDWKVIDTILVPGHSRVYYTYREFADDALNEGIAAPMRMFQHWQQKDFDVFACSSGDRFGREQSIFAEVVGRTIDAGAVVYTLRDGEINQHNKRMFISMGGYSASVEIDELRRRHKSGMNRLAEEGKPVSWRVLFSHRAVRDNAGRMQQMLVREELRPLFNDLARVLLDRTAWYAVEKVLFEQYGHAAPNGKPYPSRFFYQALRSPAFWGNNARGFSRQRRQALPGLSAWVFDQGEPLPEGVVVFYDTHEAVYTGELAAAIKAEMRRRISLRGSARPDSKYPFSSMFECDECHHKMAWTTGYRRACRCNVAYGMLPRSKDVCTQRRYLVEKYVFDYMRAICALLVEAEDVEAVLSQLSEQEKPVDETAELTAQLEALEEEGRVLIQLQMKAQPSMQKLYEEQADLHGKRMEAIHTRLMLAQRALPNAEELADQKAAVQDIKGLGERFWEQPPGKINQTLRRALGRRLFLVREGKIVRLKYLSK